MKKSITTAGVVATACFLVLVICPSLCAEETVTLDHLDGGAGPGFIRADTAMTFYLRFNFSPGDGGHINGFTNGFRVYSPDGAVWEPLTFDTVSFGWTTLFDLVFVVDGWNITGSGADTVGLGGAGLVGAGLEDGFNEIVFWISTQVGISQEGKTLCLDSSFFPPGGQWIWATSGGSTGFGPPDWNGPHCFTIVNLKNEVRLDHVDGLSTSGEIFPDAPVTFHVRVKHAPGDGNAVKTLSNGFRVYSPDGATWQPISYDTVNLGWPEMFDLLFYVTPLSVTGSGADTVGFGGSSLFGGMPDGFDEVAWTITTQLDDGQIGKTLCLDSSFVPPGHRWLWHSDEPVGDVTPHWDGPHCYTVLDPGTKLTMDQVDGLLAPGLIEANTPVTFHFNLNYTPGDGSSLQAFANAFRIYSPDGASWQPIDYDTVQQGWGERFDLGFHMTPFHTTGSGADTVGFRGTAQNGPGIEDGFKGAVWSITTQVDSAQKGKTLCLDSSFFPPDHEWLWNSSGPLETFAPVWNGPFCYDIVSLGTKLTLDRVDGLSDAGKLQVNMPVKFHIRLDYTVGEGSSILGSSNGFRIYSPDGAIWQPITYDTAQVDWLSMYEGGFYFAEYGVTGSGADTVGFGGFALFGPGIPDGFSDIVWYISTQLDASQTGKTLCLDSSFYPPAGTWIWSTTGSYGAFAPSWGGPYCFEIGCCNTDGIRGDVNGSCTLGCITVEDLSYLVDFLFKDGPAPGCGNEANVDGDCTFGCVTVSDLAYLVAFLFQNGPPPGPCP